MHVKRTTKNSEPTETYLMPTERLNGFLHAQQGSSIPLQSAKERIDRLPTSVQSEQPGASTITERESLGADAMLRDSVRDETRVIKAFVPSFSGNIA